MQSQTVCEIYSVFILIFANVDLFRFVSKPLTQADPVSHSTVQLAKEGEWEIICQYLPSSRQINFTRLVHR